MNIKRLLCLCTAFLLCGMLIGCHDESGSNTDSGIVEPRKETSVTTVTTATPESSIDDSSVVSHSIDSKTITDEKMKSWDELAAQSRFDEMVTAYRTNDYSSLSDSDRYALENAAAVIGSEIDENMSVKEKITAIHDYMISNCKYDTDELDERKGADPLSTSPEGFFKNGKAICLGYTLTFQLFMDLLEIPCITVENAYAQTVGNDHAWNAVKISDKWYYVDVTWDDPVPDTAVKYRTYLLVSSEFMKRTGHIWDEEKYPYAEDNSTYTTPSLPELI